MSRPIRGRWLNTGRMSPPFPSGLERSRAGAHRAVATRQATAVLNFGILACPTQNWLMPSLR